MSRISLFLFLFLITVGAGLGSAQTVEKKFYVVDGIFFDGIPPCMSFANVVRIIEHQDREGHKATELRLRRGFELPKEAWDYATPVENVPGGEALLMSVREGAQKGFPVMAVPSVGPTVWVGKEFPDFTLKDTEGKTWTKADIIGRPMVLNFWYTGCAGCIREMPELNKWMELFPDVTYLATTFDSAEQIRKIVENRPFRFTQIADELFFFTTFHVSGMPVTILVDKKGIVRQVEEGTSNAKIRFLQDALKRLTEE